MDLLLKSVMEYVADLLFIFTIHLQWMRIYRRLAATWKSPIVSDAPAEIAELRVMANLATNVLAMKATAHQSHWVADVIHCMREKISSPTMLTFMVFLCL